MKSVFELAKDWKFAMMLAFAFLLAGWNLAYGSKVIGYIFFILLVVPIALNIYFTKIKKKKP